MWARIRVPLSARQSFVIEGKRANDGALFRFHVADLVGSNAKPGTANRKIW